MRRIENTVVVVEEEVPRRLEFPSSSKDFRSEKHFTRPPFSRDTSSDFASLRTCPDATRAEEKNLNKAKHCT